MNQHKLWMQFVTLTETINPSKTATASQLSQQPNTKTQKFAKLVLDTMPFLIKYQKTGLLDYTKPQHKSCGKTRMFATLSGLPNVRYSSLHHVQKKLFKYFFCKEKREEESCVGSDEGVNYVFGKCSFPMTSSTEAVFPTSKTRAFVTWVLTEILTSHFGWQKQCPDAITNSIYWIFG